MATNINALPLYSASLGVSTDEDINFSLVFTQSDGVTPLSLAGIVFVLEIGSVAVLTTAPGGGLTISGASSNILSVFWPASSKQSWDSSVYRLYLAASDGTFTRNVLQGRTSSLTHAFGASSPPRLTRIEPNAATMISVASSQIIANTAAIAALQALLGGAPTIVASSPFSVPAAGGWFLIDVATATINLPAVAAGVAIILTDATMTAEPSHTVVGTINNDPSGGAINAPGGGMILGAVPALSSWWKLQ